jgi:hypothetical protein
MQAEEHRSRAARRAAESALVQVVHHYGSRPEFVVLGGLVPELLCTKSRFHHAGTTDVDVQVDLEIACGAVNAARLEQALLEADFKPDGQYAWRWINDATPAIVKFELLSDLEDEAAESQVLFNNCDKLGAVNLRGTGFAARDVVVQKLSANMDGIPLEVDVNVTGLAGFLLAKCAAARSRRAAKDWYDIVFVLLHNDAGGPVAAATLVNERFAGQLLQMRNALADLRGNFAIPDAQGPRSYAGQMMVDHPELDARTLQADAILAIEEFCSTLV